MSRQANPVPSLTCIMPTYSFVVCPTSGSVMHRCTWVMCDRTPRHPFEHICACGHHWPVAPER